MKLRDLNLEELRIHFISYDFSMGGRKPEEGDICLNRDDEVYTWRPCPNRDCTSRGYSLNQVIRSMTYGKVCHASGRLHCKGKESPKLGAKDCACWLDYDISIAYTDMPASVKNSDKS